MAVHKFYRPQIYMGGYDVQADHSRVQINDSFDELDSTAFGNASKRHIAGLNVSTLEGEVFLQYAAGAIEDLLRQFRGTVQVYLITPDTATVGDKCWHGQTLVHHANPVGGAVGEIHKTTWQSSGGNGYPPVRGQIFKAAGSTTSSSNSAMVQLGAVSATQRVGVAMHVLSVSGSTPTLDVTVRSDDNSTPTTPTTRITLTQANSVGAQFSSAAGAITDDWWGVTWTLGGGTPNFSFVVGLGIF